MIVTIKQTLIAFGLLLAVTFPAFAQSGNPVLPGFHADPEILYSNKTKTVSYTHLTLPTNSLV